MAKKKANENEPEVAAEAVSSESENQTYEPLGGLADEVQGFLAKRNELAKKLSLEIEATEKKLAELKRAAALLLPEKGAAPSKEKEKPERKPKKPSSSKLTKPTPEPANEDRPSLDQSAEPVAPAPIPIDANGRDHATDELTSGQQA